MNCQVPCQTSQYDQVVEIYHANSPPSPTLFLRVHRLGAVPIDQHSIAILIYHDVPHADVAMQYLRKTVGKPMGWDNIGMGIGDERWAGGHTHHS